MASIYIDRKKILSEKDLKDILNDSTVQNCNMWKEVGLNLGLKSSKLEKIKRDYSCTDDHKREMIYTWLKETEQPTMDDLYKAIERIRRKTRREEAKDDGQKVLHAIDKLQNILHQWEGRNKTLEQDLDDIIEEREESARDKKNIDMQQRLHTELEESKQLLDNRLEEVDDISQVLSSIGIESGNLIKQKDQLQRLKKRATECTKAKYECYRPFMENETLITDLKDDLQARNTSLDDNLKDMLQEPSQNMKAIHRHCKETYHRAKNEEKKLDKLVGESTDII